VNRRIVCEPAHRAHLPPGWEADARSVMDSLPERWDTVAVVAVFERVVTDTHSHQSHPQYVCPRWAFLKDGNVQVLARSFEQMRAEYSHVCAAPQNSPGLIPDKVRRYPEESGGVRSFPEAQGYSREPVPA
jgi:hypothetical protein